MKSEMKMQFFSWCLLLLPFAKTKTIYNPTDLINLIDSGYLLNPVPEHCGRSHLHQVHRAQQLVNKRIVGGSESQFGEWPWLVSMMLRKSGTSKFDHLCGGTLIDQQWVVTAAHCFEPVWDERLTDDPKDWMVRIGEHNLFDDLTHHVDVAPEKILFHPARNAPDTFNIDIALVKLSRPVKIRMHVRQACLPRSDETPAPGTLCVTAGWGHQAENGNVSSVVRHVQVPIVSNELCNKMYTKIAHLYKLEIPPDMMCAGFDFGGSDACQYDSGGPMMCYDQVDDEWLLSGVVSVGYGCARPGFPGIYTKVPVFTDWIQETIALN